MERGIFVERAMNSQPSIIVNILAKEPTRITMRIRNGATYDVRDDWKEPRKWESNVPPALGWKPLSTRVSNYSKERGYIPTAFIAMRRQYKTLEAIERLVQSGDIQSGFKRLCKLHLLDWTLEAAVTKFSEEFTRNARECAEWRLRQARNESYCIILGREATCRHDQRNDPQWQAGCKRQEGSPLISRDRLGPRPMPRRKGYQGRSPWLATFRRKIG